MRKPPRSDRFVAPASGAAPTSTDPKRRRFLFALGVSGAGAAAATVAAVPAIAAHTQAADNDADGRYSETAHVRDYYRTAKI